VQRTQGTWDTKHAESEVTKTLRKRTTQNFKAIERKPDQRQVSRGQGNGSLSAKEAFENRKNLDHKQKKRMSMLARRELLGLQLGVSQRKRQRHRAYFDQMRITRFPAKKNTVK